MGNFIISGVYSGPELWSYGVYSGPELQSYGTEGKSCPLGRNFASYGVRVWHSSQPGTLELRDIDFYFPCFFFLPGTSELRDMDFSFPGLPGYMLDSAV